MQSEHKGQVLQTEYMTEEAVKEHWEKNCEAFFFYCPKCNTQFRNKEHNCIKDLKEERHDLEEAVRFTREEVKNLRENEGAVKVINLLEDKNKSQCEEFWDEIYKKLTPDDRQDCLDSINEVIEA